MNDESVLIAMSGGVDSSVAAYLLGREGLSLRGATMRLNDDGADPAVDAGAVADALGIPFSVLDLRREFRLLVMEDFVRCYHRGLTPNPCIVCNRHLKFGLLLEKARELGCGGLATGHYARIRRDPDTGRWLLCKALDGAKDQSYFLYSLTQEQLSHIRFPLGEYTKDQIREIALEQGFLNARKRDSQDICFIPDGDYPAFLRRHRGQAYPAGDFLDLEGRVVGRHTGAVDYTLGQRKGLGLAMGQPVYVCAKDMAANTVTVGPNEALFHRTLIASDWFFFPFDTLREPLRAKAKTRSRMIEQPATVHPLADGRCRVVFDQPQRAITPGQAVVLYDGDTVIGGGTIEEVVPDEENP